MELTKVQVKNTITFYSEDGSVLGNFHLEGGTTHDDRCEIAKDNGLEDWHHYSMHNASEGCKRVDNKQHQWYNIDLTTGKITREVPF